MVQSPKHVLGLVAAEAQVELKKTLSAIATNSKKVEADVTALSKSTTDESKKLATRLEKVQEALAKNNITTETAEITMVAKMNVDVDAETARKITKLLLNLDDHDDVQNVHCNVHMSTEVLAELENE